MKIFILYIISVVLGSTSHLRGLQNQLNVLEQEKNRKEQEIRKIQGRETFGERETIGDVSRLEADLNRIENQIRNKENEIRKAEEME